MRFLHESCSLNSFFPIGQYLLEVISGGLEGLNVSFGPPQLFLCVPIYSVAWSARSITSFENSSQFSQRESDANRPLHREHSLNRVRGIEAVTSLGSQGPWKNTDPLVMPNGIWAYACCLSDSTNEGL
jgi:hypothetical protein